MTFEEYQQYEGARQRAISRNRSLRMRGLPTEPIGPKLPPPTCRVAYGKDGSYIGRLQDDDEAPEGAIIKTEEAHW